MHNCKDVPSDSVAACLSELPLAQADLLMHLHMCCRIKLALFQIDALGLVVAKVDCHIKLSVLASVMLQVHQQHDCSCIRSGAVAGALSLL